jgi:two-component system, chemotaxis family, CheB/CheR fusion protein
MVLFEEVTAEQRAGEAATPSDTGEAEIHPRIPQLEQELRSTKEYLQATVEELETSNEELKSTNEELQSANEELQSTNEELETSKEELQSVNEELSTVNSELQQKIEVFSSTSSDLSNLLASTQIGTIFLDMNLNIRRFTPTMTDIINLIQSDIGRPVAHIVSNLEYDGLVEDANRVLKTLTQRESELRTRDGRWYTMRILPYRTIENVIDGLVITFVDISKRKDMEKELTEFIHEVENARSYLEDIVATVREPLVVLNKELQVKSANKSFYQTFHVEPEDTEGRHIYDLGNRQWDIPELREFLESIVPTKREFNDFRVAHDFPDIGHRTMLLNARRIISKDATEEKSLVLLAIEDITGRDQNGRPPQQDGENA